MNSTAAQSEQIVVGEKTNGFAADSHSRTNVGFVRDVDVFSSRLRMTERTTRAHILNLDLAGTKEPATEKRETTCIAFYLDHRAQMRTASSKRAVALVSTASSCHALCCISTLLR
jgi:hypothetical protein